MDRDISKTVRREISPIGFAKIGELSFFVDEGFTNPHTLVVLTSTVAEDGQATAKSLLHQCFDSDICKKETFAKPYCPVHKISRLVKK